MKTFIFYFSISLILITTIPALVSAECTCEAEDEGSDKAGALKYKVAAIPCILLAGALGVLFPLLGNVVPALQPETNLFFAIKAFAAGVILSTGFIHVLPEAFEMLTSPCLKNDVWEAFPFTGFIAMVAAIGTLSVDAFATSFFKKSHFAGKGTGGGEEDAAHHPHRADTEAQSKTQLLRHRVVAQVLEVGIIVHSVIIGIALGASQDPEAVKPLFAALMFHQCFEGMGLGGCITQAKFKWSAVTVMTLFFSVTTPVGIGIGMGISNSYNESSPTALIVQGVLNAASAGILIYMALVDFLAADFMHPKMQASYGLQVVAHVALLLGAALMSVLAKWA